MIAIGSMVSSTMTKSSNSSKSKPTRREFGTVENWLSEVKRAATQNKYFCGVETIREAYDNTVNDDDEFVMPLISAKSIYLLKSRFLFRLAKMFGDGGAWNAPTISLMREKERSVSIRLSRLHDEGETRGRFNLPEIAGTFSSALGALHNNMDANATSEHYRALQDIVVALYIDRLSKSIEHIRELFQKTKARFDDVVTGMMGVSDEAPMALDTEVGDLLIGFYGSITTLEVHKISDENLSKLLQEAYNLYRFDENGTFKQRLTYIMGSSFSNEFYTQICVLAAPRRAINTFTLVARQLHSFCTVTLESGLPKLERACPPLNLPQKPITPQEFLSPAIGGDRGASPHLEQPLTEQDRFLAPARTFLVRKERNVGLLHIRPIAKRHALMLIAALLVGQPPEPDWEAYYAFGFAACQNESQVQKLGGLYKTILMEAHSKLDMFADLWSALERYELPEFFVRHDWSSFHREFPRLERFLKLPDDKRESVYRLTQFIRSKYDTDPTPVLIRDYGFHMCRMRDEVEALKGAYRKALETLTLSELHNACINGLLRQAVLSAGVHVPPRYHNLFENHSYLPGAGFDEIVGSRILQHKRIFKRHHMQLMSR